MPTSSDFELALSNCNREPIHLSEAIQSFGCLISCDESFQTIRHVSANLSDFFPWDAEDVLGENLSKLFPGDLIHEVCNVAGVAMGKSQRQYMGVQNFGNQSLDLNLHQSGDRMIMELSLAIANQTKSSSTIGNVHSLLGYFNGIYTSDELLAQAVILLRHMTGYDRVKIYRFLPDGCGEVTHESLGHNIPSFLGLRYPAYDIPQPARDLALKMPIRVIVNPAESSIPLLSLGPPLDLTQSYLRGVSPIHAEYLINMGVGASLGLSIVVQGKLWGLFSCHHLRPKALSSDECLTYELFSQLFSVKLQQLLAEEELQQRRHILSVINYLETPTPEEFNFAQSAAWLGESLCPLIKADGLAIVARNQVDTEGDTPAHNVVQHIVSQCQTQLNSDITPLAQLSNIALPPDADLGQSAGALVLTVSHTEQLYLVFFRNAITSKIHWGGNPEKEIVEGKFGPRLKPRSSFNEYIESVQGKCSPWTEKEIEMALELRLVCLKLSISKVDLINEEALRRQMQQDLLIAELNHRVKNILALIQSVIRQSYESAFSLSDYASMLEQRIIALGSAHDLVAGNGIEWPLLKDLFNIEFRPYLAESKSRVKLAGPTVGLKANVVPTFILALHELVSNAAKYGAFSVREGSIDVSWFREDGGLTILWRERNGPLVITPSRKGFGRNLIERSLAYEFEGKSRLRFAPMGLEAEFWIPNTLVLWDTKTSKKSSVRSAVEAVSPICADYAKARVLIVEDNLLIAMDVEKILKVFKHLTIDTSPKVKLALGLLENEHYDLAILDIDLNGENSFAVAEELYQRGIPFFFLSGFNSKYKRPPNLETIQFIHKPIQPRELCKIVHAYLKQKNTQSKN